MMIPTVLPALSLLAMTSAATIDDVAADVLDNKLTVAVTTSSDVDARQVTTKIANGKLHLYLAQGHVRPDRRRFGDAERTIDALPRSEYAKVEVPFGAGLECAGPVQVEMASSGFRASVGCRAQGATAATVATVAVTPVAAHAEPLVVPTPKEILGRQPVALKPVKAAEIAEPARAQKRDVQQAAEAVEAARTVSVAHVAAPEAARAQAVVPVAAPVAVTVPSADPAAEIPAVEATAQEPLAAAPALATEKPRNAAPVAKNSLGASVAMPAFALILLAGGAFVFSRKRVKHAGMIHILETAQLGPKRSLVVARINGETMILGTSEAGITRLSGIGEATTTTAIPPALPPPGVPADMTMDASDAVISSESLSAVPKPDPFVDESGLLARLFRARAPRSESSRRRHERFDDLLEESVADQELRQKLSAGFSGKVS